MCLSRVVSNAHVIFQCDDKLFTTELIPMVYEVKSATKQGKILIPLQIQQLW